MLLSMLFSSICSSMSIGLSALQILLHLWYYSEPRLQVLICRIVLMVPLYSSTTILSVFYPERELILSALRDW